MAQYRLLEITHSSGMVSWRVEKKILGLWWSEYFAGSGEWGSTYYDKQEAINAYNDFVHPENRYKIKIIAQNN